MLAQRRAGKNLWWLWTHKTRYACTGIWHTPTCRRITYMVTTGLENLKEWETYCFWKTASVDLQYWDWSSVWLNVTAIASLFQSIKSGFLLQKVAKNVAPGRFWKCWQFVLPGMWSPCTYCLVYSYMVPIALPQNNGMALCWCNDKANRVECTESQYMQHNAQFIVVKLSTRLSTAETNTGSQITRTKK